jgi:hypothetical protein
MNVVSVGEQKILEGTLDGRPMLKADDITDVIGSCFENGTRLLLLYAENLTEHFFDLSSGETGVILQKLRNYHIKTAVVAPAGEVKQSHMFGEMMKEENKGSDFRTFDDRQSAEAWLTQFSKV